MRSARENGPKCVGGMHRKAHLPSRERLVTARRLGSTFVILIRTRILVQRRGKHDPLCNAESKAFLVRPQRPDYVGHDPGSLKEMRGPEGVKQYVATTHAAFANLRITVEDQWPKGMGWPPSTRSAAPTGTNSWASPYRKPGDDRGDRRRPNLRRQDRGELGRLRRPGHDAAGRRHARPGAGRGLASGHRSANRTD